MSAAAYAKIAIEGASPRDLEANLLLTAAARLHAVRDSLADDPAKFKEAVVFNRTLWTIFIDAVRQDENQLAPSLRKNILQLGIAVMGEVFALTTKPRRENLDTIIRINKAIATGLRAKN